MADQVTNDVIDKNFKAFLDMRIHRAVEAGGILASVAVSALASSLNNLHGKAVSHYNKGTGNPKPGDPNFIGPLIEIDAARAANWTKPDGSTWWPPNNGAVPSSEKTVTMKPGETFGRIGNNKGSYVAPWFDMPGSGTQYKLPMSIEQLLKEQFIVPIN